MSSVLTTVSAILIWSTAAITANTMIAVARDVCDEVRIAEAHLAHRGAHQAPAMNWR